MVQLAAWPLSYAVISHPQLIEKHFGTLIKNLKKPGLHDAVKRNTVRLLQDIVIPKKYHGKLVDICFKFILSQTQPLAIRAFAISVAANICKSYPELKNELLLILNDLKQFPQAPAIKVRIRNAFKALKVGE